MEATIPQARMNNPVFAVPGAFEALQSFHTAIERTRLPAKTIELVNLRASQINGCGVCVIPATAGASWSS